MQCASEILAESFLKHKHSCNIQIHYYNIPVELRQYGARKAFYFKHMGRKEGSLRPESGMILAEGPVLLKIERLVRVQLQGSSGGQQGVDLFL